MLKDFRRAFARDRVDELGQAMLDNNLVRPGMSHADVADQAELLKQKAGRAIGEAYDRLADAANANPDLIRDSLATVDPKTMLAEITSATRDPKIMPKLGTAKYKEAMDQLAEQIAGSGKTHDVRFLNDVIGELDSKINWAKRTPEMSDQMQGLVAVRRYLRQKVNDVADRLGEGDEALSQHLKMLNKQYGNMAEIANIARDRFARESANRVLSPSDYGTAALGALIGGQFGSTPEEKLKHAAEGAVLGAGHKIIRKYGNQAVSLGASKAAQALAPVSKIPNNPAVVGGGAASVVNNLRRK
jgi:hypothetical protein